ncbi:hypothetical protein L7H23_12185 [Sphingopyxis sp. BSN-002]|uniref:hypothetical protein n=1 Tax=Sphingopyxis sp. BSN-002 TaxID=2911495 RepID=UPI001EDC028F|nr:hypothetical protein [Sphingopyxis sp. BSN-002]UKK83322.1 hypothetical protein L7H23_12185 [Sphingopyxis sp. BSN-002]
MAVLILGGVDFLLSTDRDPIPWTQILLFVPLVVLVTASFDLQNSSMPGCITVLSLLFAPLVSIIMLLLDFAANDNGLDSALGWAGAFRFPVMMFFLAGLATFFLLGSRLIRGKSPWHARAPVKIVRTAVLLGLFAGLFGLAWVGVGMGARWAGLG